MPRYKETFDAADLVKALLNDPEVNRAMREYYRITLSLRHFFRSHFASLPLGVRDYDLPPQISLEGLEEDLEMALKQDILARESGGRTQLGSMTFSRVKVTDEMRNSLKNVIWDNEQKNYRLLNKDETPPQPFWYDSKFPDPFLYFGLKHAFKTFHSTRILNIFRETRVTAMKKGTKYILGIGAQAKKWVDLWESAIKSNSLIYDKILEIVNTSPLALVDFITEARLPSTALETIIFNLPDNLADFNLVRNVCRALRNKYDALSGDNIGTRYNRKKWINRFFKLRSFLLYPYINKRKQVAGTPPPIGCDKIIENLQFSPLLLYLAFPEKLGKIEAVIPAKLGIGIKKLSKWIEGDRFRQDRVKKLALLYPTFLEILDPGKGTIGKEGFIPPLTAQDLLRAVIQALVVATRQEFNVIQENTPKKTRNLKYLRSLEAHLINLVYAHLYFGNRVKDVFGFLVNPPAFFPGKEQAKLLAAQVLLILQKDNIRTKAMAGKNSDNKSWFELEVARFRLPDEDEEDPKNLFLKGGFIQCVLRIIQVLITIRVANISIDSLRKFVASAQTVWGSHLESGGVGNIDPFIDVFSDYKLILPKIERGSKWYPKFPHLALAGNFQSNGIGNIENLFSSVTPEVKKGKNIEYWLVGPPITKKNLDGKKPITCGRISFLPVPESESMFVLKDCVKKNYDPSELNNNYAKINDEEIIRIEDEVKEINNTLTSLYPAECDLISLRRKAIIWYFLYDYIGVKVSLKEDPNIIGLLQKRLEKKQVRDLFPNEISVFRKFIGEQEISEASIETFVRGGILPKDNEETYTISAWFMKYKDECEFLEIDPDSPDFADIDGASITKFLRTIQLIAKKIDSIIKIEGSRRMSLINNLNQAQVEKEILFRKNKFLKEGGMTPSSDIRTRFQKALKYLQLESERPESELHKFINDQRGLLCEVVVPSALRARIERGAYIDAVQLLPPRKGNRVMANILVKGKREIVRTLAKFARVVIYSTINILAGGCIGLDQNRIYYPRAFAHARVGVNDGDLEQYDIPGIDLALLLDLVKFIGEENGEKGQNNEGTLKVIKYEFNSFKGNAKGSGPFHVDEVKHADRLYREDVIPAKIFLSKVRRGWIADTGGVIEGDLGYPLAAIAGTSKLFMLDATNPLIMQSRVRNSRRAGFNDQIGAPQAFWGVKRIHIARKIRCIQQLIRSKRFRISEKVDKKNPKSKKSKLDEKTVVILLRRQLTDMTYHELRNESLRKCMGEYLSRNISYILAIIKNPIAYSAEKLSLAIEGKRGGLTDIIKQMFKNVNIMWRKAAKRVVEAGVPAIPPYSEIRAAGTSKYCYSCGKEGFTGIINRRVSKDFGYCSRCGLIVDCHLNAAKNIAALHPQCTKEKGTGGVFRENSDKKLKRKKKSAR